MEIINNQINQLENEKLFRELEQKNKRAEWSRKYYINNKEKIIKQKMYYNKHYIITDIKNNIKIFCV